MLSRKIVNNKGQVCHHAHQESSEPHIIVACPYCQTKFAVEGSLVASYETPTFHCSRCDAVFEFTPLRENTAGADLTRGENTNPSQQQSTIRPSDFTLGSLDPNTENHTLLNGASGVEKSAGRALLGLSDSTNSSLSITREEFVARAERLGINESSSKPIDTTEQDTEQNDETSFDVFSLFDTPTSIDAGRKSANTASHKNSDTENRAVRPQTDNSSQIVSSRFVSDQPNDDVAAYDENVVQDENTVQAHGMRNPTRYNLAQPRVTSSARRTEPKKNSAKKQLQDLFCSFSARNRDLSRMLRPLVKITAGVLVAALLTRLMPKTIDNVFGAVIPSALSGKRLHLPSPHLSVHDLTFSFEKTLSGESIPIVRGMLSNSGETSFQNVMVEAVGFDGRGATLMRIKTPLHSGLKGKKLSEISMEDAKKFQAGVLVAASTIKAGETLPFTIYMLSEKLAHTEIAFFSARIFSVGE